MRAVRDFGDEPPFDAHKERALATAAALDYVLMLVSGTAGARILERDAERAIRDGIARAVDDLIACASAIAAIDSLRSRAFAREAGKMLRPVVRAERLETDDRLFALIALANA